MSGKRLSVGMVNLEKIILPSKIGPNAFIKKRVARLAPILLIILLFSYGGNVKAEVDSFLRSDAGVSFKLDSGRDFAKSLKPRNIDISGGELPRQKNSELTGPSIQKNKNPPLAGPSFGWAREEKEIQNFQDWKKEKIQSVVNQSNTLRLQILEAQASKNSKLQQSLERQLQQIKWNLEVARELSIVDYLTLYLTLIPREDKFQLAARTLSPSEVAELMEAYSTLSVGGFPQKVQKKLKDNSLSEKVD